VFRELLATFREVERAAPIVASRTNFIRSIRRLEIRYRA
jgi:hypothetical protein